LLDTEGVEQLSAAVGAAHVTFTQSLAAFVILAEILAGQLIIGNVLSLLQGFTTTRLTVMVKLQAALLPVESVAVCVTVVTPILKQSLDLAVQDTEGVEQLSVAVGSAHVTFTQVSAALVMVAVILAGQLIVGNILSSLQGLTTTRLTVIVKLQDALFPAASVAVWVTVVTPILKQSLDLAEQDTEGVEQLSVPVGSAHVTLTQVSAALVMVAVILAGQLIVGNILSSLQGLTMARVTVIVKLQDALLPAESVAV
jgi:hypothetical protein